jgi:hypothetical protein
LGGGVVHVQEAPHLGTGPSGEWHEPAQKAHDLVGRSHLERSASQPPLHVLDLRWIDVASDDVMIAGQGERRAAGRRNAEHAPSLGKPSAFDGIILIDSAEQKPIFALHRVEAAAPPCRAFRQLRLDSDVHRHVGDPPSAAPTQAKTRKEKFFTSIPAGS